MSERSNGVSNAPVYVKTNNPWVAGPKDFIFKYLPYLPLLLLSVFLFLTIAYIKVRYTTQIFRVQSSLLIQNDNAGIGGGGSGGGAKDEKFEELFITQGDMNLSNEIELLKSTPVLQRVAKDLNLQTSYYSRGNVRGSLIYPLYPFRLNLIKKDSTKGLSFTINMLSADRYTVDEGKAVFHFGDTLTIGADKVQLIRNLSVGIFSFASRRFEIDWLPLHDVALGLQGSLKVMQINEQSTILTLSFEGENWMLGKDVLNDLMSVYDTLQVEDKNRIAGNTLRFISDRISEVKDTLRGVEGRLTNFMVENKVFNLDNQSKDYLDKLGDATRLRTEQEVKIAIVDHLLMYISDQKNMHELVPTQLGIDEPALTQAVAEYNRLTLERDRNAKTTTEANELIVGMDEQLDKIRVQIHEALINIRQAYMIAVNKLEQTEGEINSHVSAL